MISKQELVLAILKKIRWCQHQRDEAKLKGDWYWVKFMRLEIRDLKKFLRELNLGANADD